jgi:diadenosine tetraphosphatase ApaH/serine/threonine PP2A family protein phosphatase
MRYLVLSDIHANLEALEACLSDARARKFDDTLILGDIVGYGADPNAVIDVVKGLMPIAIVRGNHDKAACGIDTAAGFRAVARSAIEWTFRVLTPEHRAWLSELPVGPGLVNEDLEICHGSPRDEDEYILDDGEAKRALTASVRPLCLFGHTHFRIAYDLSKGTLRSTVPPLEEVSTLVIRKDTRYLVNPGAVGQPRDGDARAAYAVVDTTTKRVELFRVDYPFEVTQQKIIEAGLPEALARRLAIGR